MKKHWFLRAKQLMLCAALFSGFGPIFSAASVAPQQKETQELPEQLSEQTVYAPIVDLDRLAFKKLTVATDSFGQPYLTPLALAMRTYSKATYSKDESIIGDGVINNICLHSHMVPTLSEKARSQAGRVAFARHTLALQKKEVILRKQKSIRAFDNGESFKATTKSILDHMASQEKVFLEIATLQYELRPVNLKLTEALSPINWAIVPLLCQAYANTISSNETSVLIRDDVKSHQELLSENPDKPLTPFGNPFDYAKFGLRRALLVDSRRTAAVGSLILPFIGAAVLNFKERDINHWGNENLTNLKQNHQIYSLMYQITEGLQFAGDIARFGWWKLFASWAGNLIYAYNPDTKGLFNIGASYLHPSTAHNGSMLVGKVFHDASLWWASGTLLSLFSRKDNFANQAVFLAKGLALARIATTPKPEDIIKLENALKAIIGGNVSDVPDGRARVQALVAKADNPRAVGNPFYVYVIDDIANADEGLFADTVKAIANERIKLDPALVAKINAYYVKEHATFVKLIQNSHAQRLRTEHLEPLKERAIQECENQYKATILERELDPNRTDLLYSLEDLRASLPGWTNEVVNEFNLPIQAAYQPAPGANAARAARMVPFKAQWQAKIRSALSASGPIAVTIRRGVDNTADAATRINSFLTPGGAAASEEAAREQLAPSSIAMRAGFDVLLGFTPGSETLFPITPMGLAGMSLVSDPPNPVLPAAYNYSLDHNFAGTTTSPTSYWALRGVQAITPTVLTGALPLFTAYKNFKAWETRRNELQPARALLVQFAHYMRGSQALYRHIAQNQELIDNLPADIRKNFEQFFGEKASEPLAEIVKLCAHKAFDTADGFFWHVGALARLIDLLNENYETLQELSQAIGHVDYLVLLNDLVSPESAATNIEGQEIKWCFPRFVDTEKPYVNFKGFWYPGYDPVKVISTAVQLGGNDQTAHHLLITGVNGCGKSIVMSAMMSCVVFAHTHGIAPAQDAELCQFDLVMFHGNVDDAKIDGYSKGIAEILHSGLILKKIVEQMNQLGKKLRAYITMDELFCSTDQETATMLAKAVLRMIMRDPEAMLIFTTHNRQLISLEQETGGLIKNAYVDARVNLTHETVTYLRQLREGVNKELSAGLVIMLNRFQEAGLTDPFVTEVLREAINLQRAQSGLAPQGVTA